MMLSKHFTILLCYVATTLSLTHAFTSTPAFGSLSVRKALSSTDVNMQMLPVDMDTLVSVSASSLTVAETEAWVEPLKNVLDPSLNLFSFAMVSIVLLPQNYEV